MVDFFPLGVLERVGVHLQLQHAPGPAFAVLTHEPRPEQSAVEASQDSLLPWQRGGLKSFFAGVAEEGSGWGMERGVSVRFESAGGCGRRRTVEAMEEGSWCRMWE